MKFSKAEIETSIPARFEAVVDRYPKHIAIRDINSIITYRELNSKANQVARAFLAAANDPDKTIALLAGSGKPAIIMMMAALKAGKVFVPIDPSHPLDWIMGILGDSDAGLLVSDGKSYPLAKEIVNQSPDERKVNLIKLDTLDGEVSDLNLGILIHPTSYSHLFYTSGSTGKPKGVIKNHLTILHSIYNASKAYKITPQDRILLLTSPGFGASTSDIFGALLNGASVHAFPFKDRSFQDLAQYMIRERITMCHFVPTVFRHFVQSFSGSEDFSSLRMIRLGGEAIYKRDVESFKKHFPDTCILRVGLASTEAGSICWNFIDKNTDIFSEVVPVGKPVKGVEILILDQDQNPIGTGEVGEIAVRSRYLSPGYWNRPDLNKIKFLPDPEGSDRRICLMGDLGKFLPNGMLLHVGRKDSLVKIRGLRLDISEIEAVILGLDTIKEVAVEAHQDRFYGKRLVAYIVPVEGTRPTVAGIRGYITKKLPDYMAPNSYIFLESLPQTSSGKVDRRSLPSLAVSESYSDRDFVPPRDDVERKLVELFEKYLNIQPVGIQDDFFELGGDSLLVMRIVSEIGKSFNKSISIPEFIAIRNVEKIANQIQNKAVQPAYSYIVPLRKTGSNPPLFCVPPSAATAAQMDNLVKYIGEDQPVYGFEYAGMDGVSQPFTTIPAIAQAFIKDVQKIQPQGHYYICGLCLGGVVAFEIAQQLVAKGEKVAFLGVMDSNFPPQAKKPFVYYFLITRQYLANILGQEFLIPLPERGGISRDGLKDETLKLGIHRTFTAHHIARMAYTSPPYPGVITRFSTNSPHTRRTTRGWRKMTSAGLDLQWIPGGHGAHKPEGQTSFMREPNIQIVAEKLRACLQKAREESG